MFLQGIISGKSAIQIITVDSAATYIDRFIVASGKNSYTIDGTVSGNAS